MISQHKPHKIQDTFLSDDTSYLIHPQRTEDTDNLTLSGFYLFVLYKLKKNVLYSKYYKIRKKKSRRAKSGL